MRSRGPGHPQDRLPGPQLWRHSPRVDVADGANAICIHTYIRTLVYIHTYTCICIYIYVHHMCICIYIYIHTYVYVTQGQAGFTPSAVGAL